MKITKRQLRRIIKEEKHMLLKEQRIPMGLIENLNNAMTAILDFVENNADRNALHPDDVPMEALEIIEEEVAGFKEYLATGYVT
jgi:histone H3/H4